MIHRNKFKLNLLETNIRISKRIRHAFQIETQFIINPFKPTQIRRV